MEWCNISAIIINLKFQLIYIVGAMAQSNKLGIGPVRERQPVRGGNVA